MRKTIKVSVPDGPVFARDKGKVFQITEWPAARAERWGMEAMFAANRGGGELPLDMAGLGMEGIAVLGINTFLRGNVEPGTFIPLLDQLLECVKIIRDPKNAPEVATDIVSDDDIAEVPTRMWLRSEVLSLHVGFSVSAAFRALWLQIMTPKPSPTPPPGLPSASTLPPESDGSSRATRRSQHSSS